MSHASPVAIVTGASRGIGRAAARQLGEAGYRVAVVARGEENLRETASAIPEHELIATDITAPDAADRIVSRTVERFGRIDLLVNNAGLAPLLSIEQTTPEVWHQTIDTNLTAAFLLARACWPVFTRQGGGGVIVNVSSLAARDPFGGFFAYAAAKAGLNTLGLALAREGAKSNIRVHTLAPGATETQMFRSLPGMGEFPADQTMDPADVARVIVRCATGELAHTSGEVIWLHRGA
jgi:NAD(P)-dependent dehydrogenase (short-subunit alcohol dehydrogenase family)